jgi:Uma2 family endonuclease
MAVSYATYERLALEDDAIWELVCGKLREKPLMTQEHNSIGRNLARELLRMLPEELDVERNAPALKVSERNYVVPDVAVIPRELQRTLADSRGLEKYDSPLPFVAEVWSPSTGNYDVETKFPEYRERGDLEIWRIHPRERTVTAWRRQGDGSYSQSVYSSGSVRIESLGVEISLDRLFR